jgi:Domain of unknown function (DUF4337)
MALFLAFSETLGKSAQTEAMNLNINASDLWNFFQAKTIRRTVLLTAVEAKLAESALTSESAAKEPIAKQLAEWQKTAARYRSEPETKEGTTELSERAKEAEHERDTLLARYHNYELASAAFQIGIVLCSAAVITGMAGEQGVARPSGAPAGSICAALREAPRARDRTVRRRRSSRLHIASNLPAST